MSGYTVRQATPHDLPAVEETLRAAALPLDGVREQFGDGYAVAESEGKVIGVEGIEIYGDDGLLRSAAVATDWRGHGVGQALTRDRIDWAWRHGLRSLYLLTTTAGDYFPRFGFQSADRQTAPESIRKSREFSEACPSTATLMVLHLRDYTREMSLTQEVATMLGMRDPLPRK